MSGEDMVIPDEVLDRAWAEYWINGTENAYQVIARWARDEALKEAEAAIAYRYSGYMSYDFNTALSMARNEIQALRKSPSTINTEEMPIAERHRKRAL